MQLIDPVVAFLFTITSTLLLQPVMLIDCIWIVFVVNLKAYIFYEIPSCRFVVSSVVQYISNILGTYLSKTVLLNSVVHKKQQTVAVLEVCM